jgi:hypothetical protein
MKNYFVAYSTVDLLELGLNVAIWVCFVIFLSYFWNYCFILNYVLIKLMFSDSLVFFSRDMTSLIYLQVL